MKALGLYLHFPFCVRKCAYCDFYSIEKTEKIAAYTDALIAQIRSFRVRCKPYLVDTVYLGGGTPSIFPSENIVRILDAVRSTFRLSDSVEISMEANPGTLDPSKLADYRAAGITRLSMGLQSADNAELKLLSRIHTKEEFENSFLLARMEGFQNINVDVMYALPRQTEERLSHTLDFVCALSPEHISFYGLKVEPQTPLGGNPDLIATIPNEDTQYRMYLSAVKKLEEHGYLQYEISNFSKLGMECRHNLKYWKGEEYLGFGPGAHSFFEGRMFSYQKDLDLFLAMPTEERVLIDEETVPIPEELATQFVMTGFRLRSGINVNENEARFGDSFDARYLDAMQPFLEKKYILRTKSGYRLSRRGMLISNYILSEILTF